MGESFVNQADDYVLPVHHEDLECSDVFNTSIQLAQVQLDSSSQTPRSEIPIHQRRLSFSINQDASPLSESGRASVLVPPAAANGCDRELVPPAASQSIEPPKPTTSTTSIRINEGFSQV